MKKAPGKELEGLLTGTQERGFGERIHYSKKRKETYEKQRVQVHQGERTLEG